jgi:hypothetical protein
MTSAIVLLLPTSFGSHGTSSSFMNGRWVRSFAIVLLLNIIKITVIVAVIKILLSIIQFQFVK